jgi:hypothetical protein
VAGGPFFSPRGGGGPRAADRPPHPRGRGGPWRASSTRCSAWPPRRRWTLAVISVSGEDRTEGAAGGVVGYRRAAATAAEPVFGDAEGRARVLSACPVDVGWKARRAQLSHHLRQPRDHDGCALRLGTSRAVPRRRTDRNCAFARDDDSPPASPGVGDRSGEGPEHRQPPGAHLLRQLGDDPVVYGRYASRRRPSQPALEGSCVHVLPGSSLRVAAPSARAVQEALQSGSIISGFRLDLHGRAV